MLNRYNAVLLKRYPLLWNTKTLYAVPALLLINLAFFLWGYSNGAISFRETEYHYTRDNEMGVLMLAVLVGIFSMIVWLAFYLRNNGFKAFYPRSAFALFGEWVLILLNCFLICSSYSVYTLGKDVRHRSYFSFEEARHRMETLSMASFFYEGSFEYHPYKRVVNSKGDTISVAENSFVYEGRRYSTISLLNKDIEEYTIIPGNAKILKERIRKWLINDERDSVKATLSRFLSIANEHGLQGNIDAEKWTALVYHYPSFDKYATVAKQEDDELAIDPYNKINTANQYMTKVGSKYIVRNKYYVPAAELNYSYGIISDGYTNPDFDLSAILILAYFSFGISVLLFSFRVTSARHWLLTVVTVFILGIVIGLSSFFRTSYVPVWTLAILHLMVYGYFLFTVFTGGSKRLSHIALNLVLWTLPSLLLVLYSVFLRVLEAANGYNAYVETIGSRRAQVFPVTTMLEAAWQLVSVLSLLIAFLLMPFFCRSIRRWKALAES